MSTKSLTAVAGYCWLMGAGFLVAAIRYQEYTLLILPFLFVSIGLTTLAYSTRAIIWNQEKRIRQLEKIVQQLQDSDDLRQSFR